MSALETVKNLDNVSVRTRVALRKILAHPGVANDGETAELVASALVDLDRGLTEDLY